MAATDKTLRDQNTLDIVFAVSNVLMLVSIFWMLYQDYAREYKDEQRAFREVERAMAQHAALSQIPNESEFKKAEEEVIKEKKKREENSGKIASARAEMEKLQPLKEKAEAAFQSVQADKTSIESFINIALEHNDTASANQLRNQLNEINSKLAERQATRDDIVAQLKVQQLEIERYEGPYTKAAADFKKVSDKMDAQIKLAISKRWGWGDWFRTLPVINGFADPLRIHQFTINDIPIDYNFKYVTRYDRCMSCHVGIDRPAFTREALYSLREPANNAGNIERAKDYYKRRLKVLDKKDTATIPNPNDVQLIQLDSSTLTRARIREFAAHPRLDLFVAGNSKHPAEKFGCSSCHYGQGSGTSFLDSSHTPNNSKTRQSWSENKHWEPNHMWDFPMLPTRFVESSCIKCHHEVTDLISSDNRVEAPKVLQGFNLIKENGCFGCHEISGWKSGNRIGPDLRLEPTPPLEDLNPIERNRVINDPDNRPGTLRKVGPALSRVSEKLTQDVIAKWIYQPSALRPDTKMPQYYNLSTNNAKALERDDALIKEAHLKQSTHPKTEVASIAYFLTKNSKDYLAKAENLREQDTKDPAEIQKDETKLVELLNKGRLNDAEQREFAQVKERLKLRKESKLVDLAPKHKPNMENGQQTFIERGCLSCHTHNGTANQGITSDALGSDSTRLFGPNLSQVPAKFGDSVTARRWLISWIINPQAHSPRSRMPQTHLTPEEASDVAEWLMKQPAQEVGDDWNTIKIDPPKRQELENLARVYLTRMLSESDMKRFFKGVSKEDAAKLREKNLNNPSITIMLNDVTEEERKLFEVIGEEKTGDEALMGYLGKKAVNRLGCYGCHDIPGFENVKSIGVGLNDWGKKPADRLAFEDIGNFFKEHYYPVPSMKDKFGAPINGVREEHGKKLEPYEKFFMDTLLGHNPERMGYLNQKLRDPRSYDYNRARAWDDRARMPKFTFARPRKQKDENGDDFQKRIFAEEAEAREAVATFVLGLTAEVVPAKMTNSSMPADRMAEVKGRQILDKYNCAGCHLVRPGAFDFNVSGDTLKNLVKAHNIETELMKKVGEIDVLNHVNWVGRNPLGGDRLTSFAVFPILRKKEGGDLRASLMPSEALRFKDENGVMKNIPASKRFFIEPYDLWPPTNGPIESAEDFEREYQTVRPFGGTFANLLVPYLNQRDPKKYPLDPDGDSAEARASLPPSLIGQGERTQPQWLNEFLLNPTKVRKMAILRMPKFNMSREEAEALTHYFAAVTRQTNPGIGLTFPLEAIPQRDDVDRPDGYWAKKNTEYVARLRKMKAYDMDGKEMKGKTAYDQRLEDYKPLWETMVKEQEKSMNAELKKLADVAAAQKKDLEAKQKTLKEKKDAELQKEVNTLEAALKDGVEETKKLQAALKGLTVDKLRETWEEKEAYAADAYRLVTSRKLCAQCHQIGNLAPSEKDKQGPPLALANQRLRPDWVVHWVNKPQRFVPYPSLMPTYFNENELKFQPLHAGVAQEQLQAVRDLLMNFPRIAEMPVNRMYNPDLPSDKK